MDTGTHIDEKKALQRPPEFELADGTRLVPAGEGHPSRLEGDPDHAFCLADVQREDAEPFAGYVRQSPN
jgi:hypothetical protein